MAHEGDEQRIRERAYELWQQDGAPEGRADEYWEKAQKQVVAEGDSSIPTDQSDAHDPEGAVSDGNEATHGQSKQTSRVDGAR